MTTCIPTFTRPTDYGKSWTRIVTGIPDTAFVRAVREDPKKKGLLYAGTERGVFVSFDDGAHWRAMQLNLPIAPIHDLVVKNDDLVLATHGRSFWILDDVGRRCANLRIQSPTKMRISISHLPPIAAAFQVAKGSSRAVFAGQNPPNGAVIYYYLKQAPKQEVKIEILDSTGAVIRDYSSLKVEQPEEPLDPDDKKPEREIKPEAGLNRFVWDLQYEEARRVPGYYLWEYNDGARGPAGVARQVSGAADGCWARV